jgi:hypothetical protein
VDPIELGITDEPVYRAGARAPAGEYARVDRPGPIVALAEGERLPPSFDGTVACYARLQRLSPPRGRPRTSGSP